MPEPTTDPAPGDAAASGPPPHSHPVLASRRRFLGLGAAASAGLVLSACGLDRSSAPDRPMAKGAAWGGTLLDPPFGKPDVTFTDVDGRSFPFVESTKGKLTILFFGYTSCPDVCPVWLNTLARALEAISDGPGSRPQVLFVGVDVARDTPAVMKKYLAKFDPSFLGLTADEHTIATAISSLKMAPVLIGEPAKDGSYSVGHPAQVTVFTHDDLAHRIYPSDVRMQQWVKDLPRLDDGIWS